MDDVGAGKLKEMLALHSNRHAVHGRFTLKEPWLLRELSIDVVHEQLRSTIYEQSISPVDGTVAEDLIVSRHSQ